MQAYNLNIVRPTGSESYFRVGNTEVVLDRTIRYGDDVELTFSNGKNSIVRHNKKSDEWLCFLNTQSKDLCSKGEIYINEHYNVNVLISEKNHYENSQALVTITPYTTVCMVYSSGNHNFLHFTPTQVVKFTPENALYFLGISEFHGWKSL